LPRHRDGRARKTGGEGNPQGLPVCKARRRIFVECGERAGRRDSSRGLACRERRSGGRQGRLARPDKAARLARRAARIFCGQAAARPAAKHGAGRQQPLPFLFNAVSLSPEASL